MPHDRGFVYVPGVTPSVDELETPDFDGEPFPAAEPQEDEWPSRAHGWGMVLVVLFALMGVYSLKDGMAITGVVILGVAAGLFVLTAFMVRKELRNYMRYRRRL